MTSNVGYLLIYYLEIPRRGPINAFSRMFRPDGVVLEIPRRNFVPNRQTRMPFAEDVPIELQIDPQIQNLLFVLAADEPPFNPTPPDFVVVAARNRRNVPLVEDVPIEIPQIQPWIEDHPDPDFL